LYIQVCAGAKSVSLEYFPTTLRIRITENYGFVQVFDDATGAPIPKIYVKCFSKKKDAGKISFYKDGYTDMRGSFDYARLNRDEIGGIEKFSLLIVGPRGKVRLFLFLIVFRDWPLGPVACQVW
jgi:hypothetical protein